VVSSRRLGLRLLALVLLAALGTVAALQLTTHRSDASASPPDQRAVLIHAAAASGTSLVAETAGVTSVAMPGGRAYLLERPTSGRAPDLTSTGSAALPLVVLLHGTDVSAATEMTFTGFAALARARHFLLAAPESAGPTWNSGDGCCGTPAREHRDDTAFVASVIASVRERADVDPRRIYLVGYSAGGKLSYDVACALPGTFAATATYGAGPQLTCAHAVPRAVLVGYGMKDTTEPLAGKPHNSRGRHQPAALTVAQLRALDRCSDTETVRTVGPATIDAWTGCTQGDAVEYIRWAGQTHTFPTTPKVPASATAATLMWEFFSAHTDGHAAPLAPATSKVRAAASVVATPSAATRA
jgi:polyhydroxybutyrate depolymerase